MFDWSIANSEIIDARAWFAVIARDDPTAVSLPFLPHTSPCQATYNQWQPLLALIKLEQALNNFPKVEELFGRALAGPSGGITTAADIDIWSESIIRISPRHGRWR